jgi:hypothetical protein
VVKCQVVSAQAKRVEVMISPYIHIRLCPLPQPCIHASRHSSHGVRVILVLLACRVPTNRAQFLCKEQPLHATTQGGRESRMLAMVECVGCDVCVRERERQRVRQWPTLLQKRTNMASLVEVGLQSYRDLSEAFSATVFGTPSNETIPICASSSQEVEFFLDPYSNNKCAGSDWIVVLIMGILIHIISWWGRWLLWEPLAAWRIRSCKTTMTLDPSTKERFGMTMTSIVFHTTSAIFIFTLLTKTQWLYSPQDWSANIQQKTIEPAFKFYYLLYLSRYCSDSISMFFEDRRPDQFLQMLYHHIGTSVFYFIICIILYCIVLYCIVLYIIYFCITPKLTLAFFLPNSTQLQSRLDSLCVRLWLALHGTEESSCSFLTGPICHFSRPRPANTFPHRPKTDSNLWPIDSFESLPWYTQ